MNDLSCSRCGATAPGAACPRCGAPPVSPAAAGRRAVVLGALAVGVAVGAGTFAWVRRRPAGPAAGAWEDEWLAGAAGLRVAQERQRASGAPILVYFFTDWCGFCRRLEHSVLSTEEGRVALRDLVKVRINPEKGNEEAMLAGRLGVRGYPTLLLQPAGGTLRRLRSPQSASELRETLKTLLSSRA